jgi:hypothetical protein
MEAATLAWFGIGGLNAVLVSRILRPLGVLAALAGGLFYAIFYPAVFIEHFILLEAPAATVTLVALLLPTRARKAGPIAPRVAFVAWALLGVSAGHQDLGRRGRCCRSWMDMDHKRRAPSSPAAVGRRRRRDHRLPIFLCDCALVDVADGGCRPARPAPVPVGIRPEAHRHGRPDHAPCRVGSRGGGRRGGGRRVRSRGPIEARAARRGRAPGPAARCCCPLRLGSSTTPVRSPPLLRSSVPPPGRSSALRGQLGLAD